MECRLRLPESSNREGAEVGQVAYRELAFSDIVPRVASLGDQQPRDVRVEYYEKGFLPWKKLFECAILSRTIYVAFLVPHSLLFV